MSSWKDGGRSGGMMACIDTCMETSVGEEDLLHLHAFPIAAQ